VANANSGVCVNDITDHVLLDELSGTSAMNRVPVTVEAAHPIPAPNGERPEQEVLRAATPECLP
jgi:hypothetical protein